jgi:hypothetical protein
VLVAEVPLKSVAFQVMVALQMSVRKLYRTAPFQPFPFAAGHLAASLSLYHYFVYLMRVTSVCINGHLPGVVYQAFNRIDLFAQRVSVVGIALQVHRANYPVAFIRAAQ